MAAGLQNHLTSNDSGHGVNGKAWAYEPGLKTRSHVRQGGLKTTLYVRPMERRDTLVSRRDVASLRRV